MNCHFRTGSVKVHLLQQKLFGVVWRHHLGALHVTTFLVCRKLKCQHVFCDR